MEGQLARFSMRTVAMIVGLVGTVLALIVNVMYSLLHTLGRVTGVTADTGHFFWGLFVVLLGLSGSLLAPILPIVSCILLAVAGVALFFVVGWWALIASPFLLVAAALTLSNRRVHIPSAAA